MRSPRRFDDNDDRNEETPLLNTPSNDNPHKRTPLPAAQTLFIVLPTIAEAIVSNSIKPFINQVRWYLAMYDTMTSIRVQLVRDLPIVGGDERKVGYYMGIIVRFYHAFGERRIQLIASQTSLHYVMEAVTVICLSRLSDHIGRKPVLLACLAGTTVSIVLFGLSRTFWTIVLRYSPCGPLSILSAHISMTAVVYMAR
jgi:MFS family permease